MGEDGGMSRFISVEELFAGRHFDRDGRFVRTVVPEFQTELPGFGQHDERTRHQSGTDDHSALRYSITRRNSRSGGSGMLAR